MAAFGRSNILAVCFALLFAFLSQSLHHDSMLEAILSGKTRVLDLSYAINDKLVPWAGDEMVCQATDNASVVYRCPRRECQEFGSSACSRAHRELGKAPRPDSRRRDCAVADGMGVALAGCAEVPESGCPGQDAFSGILGGGGEAADTAEGERAWVRYAEYRPRRVEWLC